MPFAPGDQLVIAVPYDHNRTSTPGYGPDYENGTAVTVVVRKAGKPDTIHGPGGTIRVQAEGKSPIWVTPTHVAPVTV